MQSKQPGLREMDRAPGDRSFLTDDMVSLADIVAFIKRQRYRIIVFPLVATIVSAAVLFFTLPYTWEASVTLVVVPPKVSSDLKPPTLTVHGYETLLTSSSVVEETRLRLVKAGILASSDRLRVGKELRTKIFVARRNQSTTLAPIIQAFSRGTTQKQAATVANTWASVFLEKATGLMTGATDPVIKMVDANYSRARLKLNELAKKLAEVQTTYQRRINAASQEWDRKITAYNTTTSKVVAQYKAETARLINAFSADKNLETRKSQVDAVRKALADLQDEQARVNAELARKQLELAASRKTLAETSQYITLRKAITDDALWNAKVSGYDPAALDKLEKSSLLTQTINPVYQQLFKRRSQLEIEVNALIPRAKQLEQNIKAAIKTLQIQEKALSNDLSDLENLKQTRAAGLEALQAERAEGLRKLERDRDLEIQSLKRDRDLAVAVLQRDIDPQKAFFSKLADNFNDALLAKYQMSTNLEDVRLVAPARPPSAPEPRRTAVKAVIVGFVCGMIGLAWSIGKEYNPNLSDSGR